MVAADIAMAADCLFAFFFDFESFNHYSEQGKLLSPENITWSAWRIPSVHADCFLHRIGNFYP